MMSSFTSSLTRLRTLLLTQRTLRLLLRAAWIGLAGFLIGWGINDLYGTLPALQSWWTIGIVLALPSLIAIFQPLPTRALAWNLDRHFALKEQLSAAWQTSQQPGQTRISSALINDVEAILPAQRTRILQRGWFLSRDGLAALIVIILFATINIFNAYQNSLLATTSSPLELPSLAEAPTYEDLFPSGIPGLTQPSNTGPGQADPLTPDQASSLNDILSELGEALSQNPETAPAGEALQQGNLEEAAAEIERLADELENLPQEVRENAQEAFQVAAQQAEQSGEDDLSEALEQVAEELNNPHPNNIEAAEALDELASEFRRLEDQFAAMGQAGEQEPATEPSVGDQPTDSEGGSAGGTGNGGEGQTEPIDRLEGEGQTVEIEGDENPSGLLSPGEATGDPVSSSTPIIAGGNGSGETNPINSILTPYNFPWRWRDVVSKYFSPPQ